MRKLQPEEIDEAGCCEQEEGRCGGCRAPPLEPPRPSSPPQLECCEEKGFGGCSQPPSDEHELKHDPPPAPQRPEGDGEPSPPPPGEEGLRPPNPV